MNIYRKIVTALSMLSLSSVASAGTGALECRIWVSTADVVTTLEWDEQGMGTLNYKGEVYNDVQINFDDEHRYLIAEQAGNEGPLVSLFTLNGLPPQAVSTGQEMPTIFEFGDKEEKLWCVVTQDGDRPESTLPPEVKPEVEELTLKGDGCKIERRAEGTRLSFLGLDPLKDFGFKKLMLNTNEAYTCVEDLSTGVGEVCEKSDKEVYRVEDFLPNRRYSIAWGEGSDDLVGIVGVERDHSLYLDTDDNGEISQAVYTRRAILDQIPFGSSSNLGTQVKKTCKVSLR